MLQRPLGAGEIDQHLRVGQAAAKIGADLHPAGPAEKAGRVLADRRAAGDVERAGEHAVIGREDSLDQPPAHAARGAGDCVRRGGQIAHPTGSSGG